MWKSSSRIVSQSKQSFQHGKLISRRNVTGSQGSKSKTGTLVTVGGAVVLSVTGGSVLAAKTSDGYRNFSEQYIPGTASLHNLFLGPKQTKIDPPPMPIEDGLMKKKLERESSKKKSNLLVIKSEGSEAPLPILEAPILEPPVSPIPINEVSSIESLVVETLVTSNEGLTTEVNHVPEVPLEVVQEIPIEVVQEVPLVAVKEDAVVQELPLVEVVPQETAEQINSPLDEEVTTAKSAEETVKDVASVVEVDSPDFSTLVSELQSKAMEAVNKAVDAQDIAAAAIKRHVDMVFKSMEMIYEPGVTPEKVWEPVFQATQKKVDAVLDADAKAKVARMAVAQLKETVALGLKTDESILSPELITLDENVARTLYSLEMAKGRVDAAHSEAKILDEYRALVDTARNNLQLELSSIRPDLTASMKTGTKLGEEELNILMAHAYWKITALQKELAKQQSLEQQRLRCAMEQQRKEDIVAMEARLRVELERQYYELKAQYGHDIAMHEKVLSDQFMQQLKRQAGAHIDHVNEMLNVQQEEMARRHAGEREALLAELRTVHLAELSKLHGEAVGVQDAVMQRANKDREGREMRHLWIAAHSLINCLHSNVATHLPWEEQRQSLSQAIQALTDSTKNTDEFTRCVVESIPESAVTNGVLPQGAIKERFRNVEQVCRRVALIDENGGSLIRYALSYVQSVLVGNPEIRSQACGDETIDLGKLNTFDILARTRYHLEKDNLHDALRFMNLLSGEPHHVAEDWLKDLRLHLEAAQAARAVLAYASAKTIESV